MNDFFEFFAGLHAQIFDADRLPVSAYIAANVTLATAIATITATPNSHAANPVQIAR